jgi:RHS repeat-associated protein
MCNIAKINQILINYFITDHLGSTRVIVDNAGNITAQYNYYPFGKQWEDANLIANTNRWGFNGKEKQTVYGINYLDYGARMYDEILGRWMSLDPLAIKYYSLSPYSYCANNPLKYIDPDGKKIRGVQYNNGQFSYTKQAQRNGTDKYINARIQTKSGNASIMSMVGAKQTYSLMVTDKILVAATGKGKYARLAGIADSKTKTIVISTDKTKTTDLTQQQLKNAVSIDDNNNLTSQSVNIDKLVSPLSNPDNADQNGNKTAYEDSGMAQFDNEHPYQSVEEQINGTGAHEEEHLTPDNIEKQNIKDEYQRAYQQELPAYEAEKQAREEWLKQNREGR